MQLLQVNKINYIVFKMSWHTCYCWYVLVTIINIAKHSLRRGRDKEKAYSVYASESVDKYELRKQS